MSRMPGAVWLGEHGSRLMTRYDVVCVHTIVGYAPAHAAHFSVKLDGTIQQSRDTRFQSAANLNGNPRVIAIENEDHGPGMDWSKGEVPALTAAQVKSNARILRWAHEEHGVPLQLCPDSRAYSRGLGYHRQGIDGNFSGYRFPGRVSGGEVWTEHYGKICPGDAKIAQLPQILELAREGDDDMPAYRDWADADKKALAKDVADAVLDRELGNGDTVGHNVRRAGDTKELAKAIVDKLVARWGAGNTTAR